MMDIQTLEREVLSLPVSSRARLAHELLGSLDDLRPDEIAALWMDEAGRRLEAHDAGLTQAIPAAEVFRKAQALLK